MNRFERIRRFWGRQPEPDHPLSKDEREPGGGQDRTDLGFDERARTIEEFVGNDFDPDDR